MISLILTVRNEMPLLLEWFLSIDNQIVPPDEIVIVDGGSTDGTWEFLHKEAAARHNLRVFQHKGNIASGRNRAIAESSGEFIAVTDAGCVYDPEWLRDLTAPLIAGTHTVSATAFAPWFVKGDNIKVFAIAACTMPQEKEFARDWLPSSRSFAFVRSAGERAGLYPEWIPFCEDILFDKALFSAGESCGFMRSPRVYWRPRLSFLAFVRQVKNYTRSEAHAGLNMLRHAARHAVYIVFPLYLFVICNSVAYMPILFLGSALFAVYLYKYILRAAYYSRGQSVIRRLCIFASTVFYVILGDISKIFGFWVGIFERFILRVYIKK